MQSPGIPSGRTPNFTGFAVSPSRRARLRASGSIDSSERVLCRVTGGTFVRNQLAYSIRGTNLGNEDMIKSCAIKEPKVLKRTLKGSRRINNRSQPCFIAALNVYLRLISTTRAQMFKGA